MYIDQLWHFHCRNFLQTKTTASLILRYHIRFGHCIILFWYIGYVTPFFPLCCTFAPISFGLLPFILHMIHVITPNSLCLAPMSATSPTRSRPRLRVYPDLNRDVERLKRCMVCRTSWRLHLRCFYDVSLLTNLFSTRFAQRFSSTI